MSAEHIRLKDERKTIADIELTKVTLTTSLIVLGMIRRGSLD
jgi:hypothetical protein